MAEEKTKTYFQGKPVEGFTEVHEHVSPVSAYLKVLVALFFLTGLTYAVSFADLGPASLPVAMIVAFVKASLVCAYFMHLRYDEKYHVFIFVSTLLFVGIFFTFTLFDLAQRDRLVEEQDTFFRRGDGNWQDDQHLKKPRPVAGAAEAKAEDGKAPAGGDAKAGAGDAKAKPQPRKIEKKSAPVKVDLRKKDSGKRPPTKAAGDAKKAGG